MTLDTYLVIYNLNCEIVSNREDANTIVWDL